MLSILILITGCVSKPATEIIVPTIRDDFYQEALSKVDEMLEDDPSNANLIEQKLFYCDATGWTSSCKEALDSYKNTNGMSEDLFQTYLDFYEAGEEHSSIINLVNDWRDVYELTDTQYMLHIKSLLATKRSIEVKRELTSFLGKNKNFKAQEFAAMQYMALGDTLLAIYYLSKVRKANSMRPSMIDYGKMLFGLGYPNRGIEVLEEYSASPSDNQTFSFDLASFYDEHGYYGLARKKLRNYSSEDAVCTYISELYQKEGLLDSAILYMDSILIRDSENVAAIKTKASLYDQKGWLSTSLKYYEQAFVLDSTDTALSNQIAVIQRKIAYLQRRKFEESKAPLLQLESKKIINK